MMMPSIYLPVTKSEKSSPLPQKTELEIIKSLIKQSKGARDFVNRINATDGFRIQGEDAMGVTVLGKNCKFIFSVLASHGSDKIFSLVFNLIPSNPNSK